MGFSRGKTRMAIPLRNLRPSNPTEAEKVPGVVSAESESKRGTFSGCRSRMERMRGEVGGMAGIAYQLAERVPRCDGIATPRRSLRGACGNSKAQGRCPSPAHRAANELARRSSAETVFPVQQIGSEVIVSVSLGSRQSKGSFRGPASILLSMNHLLSRRYLVYT